MKTCKKSATRLVRVAQVGTALGVAIFAASALEAQTYDVAQPSGFTTPSGVTQPAGLPAPLGATQTPPAEFMYPAHLGPEAVAAEPAMSLEEVRGFVKRSSRGSQTETALADIAEARSQDSRVIQLAQSARIEEARNNGQLQSMAQEYGVTLAASPDPKDRREIDRLQAATGAELDQEYTKMVLAYDVKSITRMEKAIQEIAEQDVASYATANLPRLRNQVRRAESAARSVGVDEDTIASILKDLPSEDRGVAVN